MPVRVEAPDGTLVEFPDGMSEAQMAEAMRREYGGPDNRKTSQSLGFMKGVARPMENVNKVNPVNMFDTAGARDTREAARGQMNNYFAQREQTERPGLMGEVAGNIVGTIPAMAVTKNPFIGGGLQGAMLTDAETPAGVGLDVAAGAGLGWLGGKVVDGIADAVKPAIAPAVRRLSDMGVRLSPGMVKGGKAMAKEDKLMSRPGVGDAIRTTRQATQSTFNTAAINETLAPLGKKVPSAVKPGYDSVQYAKDEIGRAYDLVIPNVAVQINGPQFGQRIATAARNLRPAEQADLQQIVSNELGNGRLAGQQLKDAQGEIRRQASLYKRSQNAHEQKLGFALDAVDEELTAAMLAQNPKWAPELQKVNAAYRNYRIVADAASRADEGLISTTQLKQSSRRGDFSKSKDATGRGQGPMGQLVRDSRAVIPAQTPDSGTAGRMQAQNIFAQLGGARDAFAYRMDDAYQQFRLAPRPAGARKVARTVRRLKGPASAAAVAASTGVTRD